MSCVVNVKIPTAREVGAGFGPGCLPLLSQAHEVFKFWILNGSLFLADLFGLNSYMFSAYFYAPVLVHKSNQEQEPHCSSSIGCTGWRPPKPQQSPSPALLGPWACEFIKGSEGVNTWAHPSSAMCPCRSHTPQSTMGWQGWSVNGVGQRNPSHAHVWISSCHRYQWQTSRHSSVLIFPPSLLFEGDFYLSTPLPSPHACFTRTCLSGQRAGKRLILHCKEHRAEYFSFDIWDVCYHIAVFLN